MRPPRAWAKARSAKAKEASNGREKEPSSHQAPAVYSGQFCNFARECPSRRPEQVEEHKKREAEWAAKGKGKEKKGIGKGKNGRATAKRVSTKLATKPVGSTKISTPRPNGPSMRQQCPKIQMDYLP